MPDRPLKYRDMIRCVGRFGVQQVVSRGKGSHRMLMRVIDGKLHRYPVPCHNEGVELSSPIIRAVRRRFNLTPEHGVDDARFYDE